VNGDVSNSAIAGRPVADLVVVLGRDHEGMRLEPGRITTSHAPSVR